MKTKGLILMILGFLIISACSREQLDEIPMQTSDLNLDLKKSEFETSKKVYNLIIKGEGKIQNVKPDVCSKLDQFNLEGLTKEMTFGNLKTKIINCKDHAKENYLKGMFIKDNGNELWFYSSEFGQTKDGFWYIIHFYGGTGKFEFVEGKLKMSMTNVFQNPSQGKYIITGEGELYILN